MVLKTINQTINHYLLDNFWLPAFSPFPTMFCILLKTGRIENAVAKGENARYKQLFLFPQCFKKTCTADMQEQGLVWERVNPLLHRYSFQRNNNRQLLKTSWEKKKLLVPSNFFFSHNVFYSIRKFYPHLSIFFTSYLYLLLNWKSPKLASEVKG